MRLLILDIDTLRPDHLGCYGYARRTSPNIDRLAADGVRFTNYHCSDAPCLPSRAALVTGRFGFCSGIAGHGGTAADLRLEGAERGFTSRFARESLWSVFRRQGMPVVSISPFAERHSAWWFLAGTSEVHNPGRCGLESAEHVTPLALDWIRRRAREDNWVLHVNYWDPHTPYRAPADFGHPFADEPLPAWHTAEVLARHRGLSGGHGAHEMGMFSNRVSDEFARRYPRHPPEIRDMAQYRQLIDGYDTGIRYADEHVGRLLEALAAEGVLDDLAVIVTSDHGENLGELNCYAEHGTSDAITHRIPMIVRWPGGPRGRVDSALRYHLDLSPTLAEWFGQPAEPRWDGVSYAGVLRGEEAPGREALVLSQCCHGCMRSVRFGSWIYIRTVHDFYHLFPPEMLFQLEEDPHEQHNRAGDRPDLCREGAGLLLAWQEERMYRSGGTVDPLWTVMREGGPMHSRGRLREYVEFLKATGRGGAVPELQRRHPQEFA